LPCDYGCKVRCFSVTTKEKSKKFTQKVLIFSENKRKTTKNGGKQDEKG
jgi:hypothetical protein